MARIVKEDEYTLRRNEILDTAQRLVYVKGYEQMSIQDILEERQISKGAFYHYFDSKGALLEAMIERMLDEAMLLLQPIVDDPNLAALDKLKRYFSVAGRWKVAQKAFLLEMLRVWYNDDNAIVRQKITSAGLKRIAPMIDAIVAQGVNEGVFKIPFLDRLGEVSLSLMYSLGDTITLLLLARDDESTLLENMVEAVSAYTHALERILGAPSDSIVLVEPEILEEWLVATIEVQT